MWWSGFLTDQRSADHGQLEQWDYSYQAERLTNGHPDLVSPTHSGGAIGFETGVGILERLGISVVPDSETAMDERSIGWTVTVPGARGWTEHYADFAEVRSWLYSWGALELPEYLALRRFSEILDGASRGLLEELSEWIEGGVLSAQAEDIRAEVYRIALHQDVDLRILSESIEDVIRERVGREYESLGQRLSHLLAARL